jgi:hypothetical protein
VLGILVNAAHKEAFTCHCLAAGAIPLSAAIRALLDWHHGGAASAHAILKLNRWFLKPRTGACRPCQPRKPREMSCAEYHAANKAHHISLGSRACGRPRARELDASYDQTYYEPLIRQVSQCLASNSEAARGAPLRSGYGSMEIKKLDIYPANRAKAPIFVFIHGRAWDSRVGQGGRLSRRDVR